MRDVLNVPNVPDVLNVLNVRDVKNVRDVSATGLTHTGQRSVEPLLRGARGTRSNGYVVRKP